MVNEKGSQPSNVPLQQMFSLAAEVDHSVWKSNGNVLANDITCLMRSFTKFILFMLKANAQSSKNLLQFKLMILNIFVANLFFLLFRKELYFKPLSL